MKENDVQPTQNNHPGEEEIQGNEQLTAPADGTPVTSSETAEPAETAAVGSKREDQPAGGGRGGKGWMIASLLLAAALIVVLIVNPFGKNTGKETVASVNNVEITKDKLYESLVDAGGPQILEGLITEEVIKQEMDKKSIKITEEDINKEMDSIKKMFPSDEQFEMALGMQGLTMENFKEQTKMQLQLTKLLGDQIKVTDEEIKTAFEQNKARFDKPEMVHASHILVKTKEEAEAIIKQLKDEKADFAAIAKEKSTDPGTKDKGGDLGFFGRGEMTAPFEEAAFKMKKGDISSEPVKSEHGFHVIKVTDRQEEKKATLEENKEEVRKQIVAGKVGQQAEAYIQGLRDKADIKNTLDKKDNEADVEKSTVN